MSSSYNIFSIGFNVFTVANIQIREDNRNFIESYNYCHLDMDIELFV
jgi:hypothetical protein